jgi:hypothetical protein
MTSQPDQGDGGGGYIRGGGGIIDTRRAVRVLVGSCLVVLATLVVVLLIEAVNKNSRLDRLHSRGVPVNVTVTGCLGLASGTGITVTSYDCSGTFVLGGRSYTDVIVGTNVAHPIGETLKGVTDPKNPATLSTADSLAVSHSSWRAYTAPGVTLLVLVALIAIVVWRSRRNALARPPEGEARQAH